MNKFNFLRKLFGREGVGYSNQIGKKKNLRNPCGLEFFLSRSPLYSLFIFYDTWEMYLLVKEMRNERDWGMREFSGYEQLGTQGESNKNSEFWMEI